MKNVAVVFWSGTGNTEAMAEAVAKGARAAGASASAWSPAAASAGASASALWFEDVPPPADDPQPASRDTATAADNKVAINFFILTSAI